MRRVPPLVLFAVACAAVSVAADATSATRRAAPAEARYVDSLGWSFSYPRPMHLERSQSPRYIRLDVFEVTVASFPMRAPIRAGSTPGGAWMRVEPPRDAHGRFPADGIAFRVVRTEGGPAPNIELPESRFPIRLATFGRSSEYGDTSPPARGRTVVADGRNYTVQAWIGPNASTAIRNKLAKIVSSLTFPRLRVGQTVGYGFRVFEPASSYRVRSFTRVRVQGPFYLVHAPGGFYAIGWTWETFSGGYKSHCDLHLDSRLRQFFCTNMAARWDRVGRVLTKPAGATRGDPLNVTVAKVAWDGHALVFPGAARFAGAQYAHEMWPAAYSSR